MEVTKARSIGLAVTILAVGYALFRHRSTTAPQETHDDE
jgi:hypothetical protein